MLCNEKKTRILPMTCSSEGSFHWSRKIGEAFFTNFFTCVGSFSRQQVDWNLSAGSRLTILLFEVNIPSVAFRLLIKHSEIT